MLTAQTRNVLFFVIRKIEKSEDNMVINNGINMYRYEQRRSAFGVVEDCICV